MSKPQTLDQVVAQFARGLRSFRGVDLKGSQFPLVQFSHIDLSGANLQDINWSGADLIKANLSRANLRGAKLIGADLSGANLVDANLEEAILSGAILIGAYLSRANLKQAVLSGAILTGAILRDSNLQGTNLVGADLSSADLFGADVCQRDLEEAQLTGAILPDGREVFDPANTIEPAIAENNHALEPGDEGSLTSITQSDWDNEQLIHTFLDIRGLPASSFSNGDLQLHPLGGDRWQLSTMGGQAIALLRKDDEARQVILHPYTPFTDTVAAALTHHHFYPSQPLAEPGTPQVYDYVEVAPDYQATYGTSRQLWKTWWMTLKEQPEEITPDLQILEAGDWQPVQDISFVAQPQSGILIKRRGEADLILATDVNIAWIQKTDELPSAFLTIDSEEEGTEVEPVEPTQVESDWQSLRDIITYDAGVLRIQTAMGELAIKGENIRCLYQDQPIPLDEL